MRLAFAAALAVLACLPSPAATQNLEQSGRYLLHYNALPSTRLPDAVARRYAIVRSPTNIVLTVSLQKRDRPGYPSPVPAEVAVTAIDPQGRRQPLQMREIDEGGAVSYLGQARIERGREARLEFEIQARPLDATDSEAPVAPLRARYTQHFFAERRPGQG